MKNLQDLATEYEKKVKILQEDQSKKDNTISDLQQALGVLSARNDEVEDENVALKETIQNLEAELTSKNDSPLIKRTMPNYLVIFQMLRCSQKLENWFLLIN